MSVIVCSETIVWKAGMGSGGLMKGEGVRRECGCGVAKSGNYVGGSDSGGSEVVAYGETRPRAAP